MAEGKDVSTVYQNTELHQTVEKWTGMIKQSSVSSQHLISYNYYQSNSDSIIDILLRLLCEARQPEQPNQQKVMFKELKKTILFHTRRHQEAKSVSERLSFNMGLLRDLISCSDITTPEMPSLFRSSSQVEDLLLHHHYLLNSGSNSSDDRYGKDFIEEEQIGMGGFGVVVRARNIIDRHTYAVKKIVIGKDKSATELMFEAQALASLNHPNIVRYYSAWLQPFHPSHQVHDSNSSSDQDSFSSSSNIFPFNRKIVDLSSNSDDIESEFIRMDNIESFSKKSLFLQEVSSDKFLENPELLLLNNKRHISLASGNSIEFDTNEESESSDSSKSNPFQLVPYTRKKSSNNENRQTLFIQMSLCGISLKTYLNKRNISFSPKIHSNIFQVVNAPWTIKIFVDIVNALSYIHSHHIIHRDLKPANILLSMDGRKALLSDFGLVTENSLPVSSSQSVVASRGKSKSIGVGTPPYAAPESENGIYDTLSDMFGLGIILYELFHPYITSSERARSISDLKERRTINSAIDRFYPKMTQLVLSLTEKFSHKRPSSSEVLKLIQQFQSSNNGTLSLDSIIYEDTSCALNSSPKIQPKTSKINKSNIIWDIPESKVQVEIDSSFKQSTVEKEIEFLEAEKLHLLRKLKKIDDKLIYLKTKC